MLEVKLRWSDYINVSQLRIDLKFPENSKGYWKTFDKKYPDLLGLGVYMYIHERQKITYIGETARAGERSFRVRSKEELLPNSTFTREMGNLGIKFESLELKVARIESFIVNGNAEIEIDTKRIEKRLTCAVAPLYDPHGPTHAKEDFEIHNSGKFSPLNALYAMKKREECKCLRLSQKFELV